MKSKYGTLDLIHMAIGASLIVVCSWITIPFIVPFTLQTFAVFTVVELLGGKKGCLSILVYILLGTVGLPVFSGFKGGVGVLIGTTGGYIIGFIFIALIYQMFDKFFGRKISVRILALVTGLIVCYAFGTAWFMIVYTGTKGAVDIGTALGWCVIPFIIPDLVKLTLAMMISLRVSQWGRFSLTHS